MNNKNPTTGVPVEITIEGSLGLLALGDIGLREWRKVRNELQKTKIDEEE
ncbi:hypothetical protein [Aequorivita sp. Q41]